MCTSLFAEQIVNGQLDVSIHIQEVWDQTAVNVEIALVKLKWKCSTVCMYEDNIYNENGVDEKHL